MPKTDIIETVVTAPPSPFMSSSETKKKIRVQSVKEYVSGGERQTLMPWPIALPSYSDDLGRDFGDDIYERMMRDPAIFSCVETLKRAVLAQGFTITPAVGDDDPRHKTAVEIADFCKTAVAGLAEPLESVLYDLLDAFAFGYHIAEIVYKYDKKGKLTLDRLKTKHRRTISLVVDAHNNLLGVLGLEPGKWQSIFRDSYLTGPQLDNLLPLSKFALLTYRKRNGDPRGQSGVRAAYTPWILKQQVYPELMRHLSQFGTPSIIAKVGPESDDVEAMNEQGLVVLDDEGFPKRISAKLALGVELARFRNGTYLVVDHDTEIDTMTVPDGAGVPFQTAIANYNEEIVTAILLQTLMTGEGKHQARAASEVHQDVFSLLAQGVKSNVQDCIRLQIFRNLVVMNEWGEENADLTPLISLTETEQQDFGADATAIGGLFRDGFLDPSQLPELDARLGIPIRSDEELQARTAKALMPPPDPSMGQEEEGEPDPTKALMAEFDLPDGYILPSYVDIAAFDDKKDDGHWVHINGHNVFIKAGGGASLTHGKEGKAAIHDAVQKHVTGKDSPSYSNIVSVLQQAVKSGKITNEKELYHALTLAHGVNSLALESGKAHPGASIGIGAMKAAVEHVTLETLEQTASDHPDPKTKKKAEALLAEVKQHFTKEEKGATPTPASQTAPEAQADTPESLGFASSGETNGEPAYNKTSDSGLKLVVFKGYSGKLVGSVKTSENEIVHTDFYATVEEAMKGANDAALAHEAKNAPAVPDPAPDAMKNEDMDADELATSLGFDTSEKVNGNLLYDMYAPSGADAQVEEVNGKWIAKTTSLNMKLIAKTEHGTPQEALQAAKDALDTHEAGVAAKIAPVDVPTTQTVEEAATQHGYKLGDDGMYVIEKPSGNIAEVYEMNAGKWKATVGNPNSGDPVHESEHGNPAEAMEAAKTALETHDASVSTPDDLLAPTGDALDAITPPATAPVAEPEAQWNKKHSGNHTLEADGHTGQIQQLPDGSYHATLHDGGDGRPSLSEIHPDKESAQKAVEGAIKKQSDAKAGVDAAGVHGFEANEGVPGGNSYSLSSDENAAFVNKKGDKWTSEVMAADGEVVHESEHDSAHDAMATAKSHAETHKAGIAEKALATDAASIHGFEAAHPDLDVNGSPQYLHVSQHGMSAITKNADGTWHGNTQTHTGGHSLQSDHATPHEAMGTAKDFLDQKAAPATPAGPAPGVKPTGDLYHVHNYPDKTYEFKKADNHEYVDLPGAPNDLHFAAYQKANNFGKVGWYVMETQSGMNLASGHDTKEAAVQVAQDKMADPANVAKLPELVQKSVAMKGLSPAHGGAMSPTDPITKAEANGWKLYDINVYEKNGVQVKTMPNGKGLNVKDTNTGKNYFKKTLADAFAHGDKIGGATVPAGPTPEADAMAEAAKVHGFTDGNFGATNGVNAHEYGNQNGDGMVSLSSTTGKWVSYAVDNNKTAHSGSHDTPEEAMIAVKSHLGEGAATPPASPVAAPTAQTGASTPSGPDHVTIGSKKVELTGDTATEQMVDDAGVEHGLTDKAKEKLKSFIASGNIKTHSDLHQKMAMAQASSAAGGVSTIGGTSLNAVAGYADIRDAQEKAANGDTTASNLLKHLGATNLKSPAMKTQAKAQAVKDAFKKYTGAEFLHSKVGAQGGSNEGGVYATPDGTQHYVKTYPDAEQAHGEAVSNAIYNALGFSAPTSKVFEHNGKTYHAAQMVDKKGDLGALHPGGIPKNHADEILKGFAADVLTGNWDAYGASGDNMSIGNDGKLYRIDNGGTLQHRAMGKSGKKTADQVNNIHEWHTYAEPGNQYSQILKAAGITRANEIKGLSSQISAIENLKAQHGSWENFIASTSPDVPASTRKTLAGILEKRTQQLSEKKIKLVGPHEAALQAYQPHDTHAKGADWVNKHYATQASKATTAEASAASWWKGASGAEGWKETNSKLYSGADVSTLTGKAKKSVEVLDALFAKPTSHAPENVVMLREFGLNDYGQEAMKKFYEEAQPGEIFKVDGYQASSYGDSVSDSAASGYHASMGFKWHIHIPKGSPMVHIDGVINKSAGQADQYSGEREMLLNRGSSFILRKTENKGGYIHHYVELLPS